MLFPQLYSLDKLKKKAEKAPKVWIKVREFEPQSQLPPDTFKWYRCHLTQKQLAELLITSEEEIHNSLNKYIQLIFLKI